MHVIALSPPNHIHTALIQYKRSLFRSTGNPSFLALPPMWIIAANPDTGFDRDKTLKRWDLDGPLHISREPINCGSAAESHWFLPLSGKQAIIKLRTEFPPIGADFFGIPLAGTGVYLGTSGSAKPTSVKKWDPMQASQQIWKKGSITAMEIVSAGDQWWKDVAWTINWRLPVRSG